MEPMIWLVSLGAITTVEHLLFGMQRATLLISRNSGVEWRGTGELLLPKWYPITKVFVLGKWGLLLSMAIFWSWKIAIVTAVGVFCLSVVAPIPYRAYKGLFQRKISYIARQDPEPGAFLQSMLDNAPF